MLRFWYLVCSMGSSVFFVFVLKLVISGDFVVFIEGRIVFMVV